MNDVREASLEPGSEGLPGGALGQALPFVLLAAGALWLRSQWDSLPARVPVHWGATGRPDRFVERSPLPVALPLLLGALLCALTLLIALAIRRTSPRGALRKPSLRMALAAEFFIAVICCAVVVASASGGRLLLPVMVFVGLATIALLGYGIAISARLRGQTPLRNPAGWHAVFYSDREDPALFVPKRLGFGYTLNFGHPAAVPVLLLMLALPLAAGLAAIFVR